MSEFRVPGISQLSLLTSAEMYRADQAAIQAGISGRTLMENAGSRAARVIMRHVRPCPAVVLAGPGNNGGDGYVIARHLKDNGWPVTVAHLTEPQRLKGDAAAMAKLWRGNTAQLEEHSIAGAGVIVDAVFGAGLARPLSGIMLKLAELLTQTTAVRVAVDVPSGVDGASGALLGAGLQADMTVTFFRKKPGHVLYPARALCGEVHVVDIGIPDRVLDDMPIALWENQPPLWYRHWPLPDPLMHKYSRGALLVLSGPRHATGAARLAARAGLRCGAGAVSLACPPDAADILAAHETAIMIKPFKDYRAFEQLVGDGKVSAVIAGPGAGVTSATRGLIRTALDSGSACVLDADALSVFANRTEALIEAVMAAPDRPVVLTPHHGEFTRLFPGLQDDNPDRGPAGKVEAARRAAALSGAIILLKGPDTVVACPQGRAAVNTNAPPSLATAGSGDVLAGIIGGLLAQGMPGFEAACAGAWVHGAAAQQFGAGLTADDLADALIPVLDEIGGMHGKERSSP